MTINFLHLNDKLENVTKGLDQYKIKHIQDQFNKQNKTNNKNKKTKPLFKK